MPHIQDPRLDPANFYAQWLETAIAVNLTASEVSYAFNCSIAAATKLLQKLVKQGKATKRLGRSRRGSRYNIYTIVKE